MGIGDWGLGQELIKAIKLKCCGSSKGSRVHVATGFTVSIWAFSSKVGFFLLSRFATIRLLSMRLQGSFHSFIFRCSKSAAAFSSRLTEGVLINSDSSSTASLVYRL